MAVTATTLEGSGGGEAQAKAGDATRSTESGDDAPMSASAVDTPARLVHGEIPSYPLQAREDGLQADVPLELVVSREGTVESAQVLRRAGYGLDDAAVVAARRFRFTPALKQGHAVRVRVAWTVEFRLHGS
jgi:TonB family protein